MITGLPGSAVAGMSATSVAAPAAAPGQAAGDERQEERIDMIAAQGNVAACPGM